MSPFFQQLTNSNLLSSNQPRDLRMMDSRSVFLIWVYSFWLIYHLKMDSLVLTNVKLNCELNCHLLTSSILWFNIIYSHSVTLTLSTNITMRSHRWGTLCFSYHRDVRPQHRRTHPQRQQPCANNVHYFAIISALWYVSRVCQTQELIW